MAGPGPLLQQEGAAMTAPRFGPSPANLARTTFLVLSAVFLTAATLLQTGQSPEGAADRIRELYFQHGDHDEAVAEGEALVASDSTSAWAWFGLAAALNWHEERGEEALEASERALAMSPTDVYFVWLRTDVLREQEGNEAAIAYADQLTPEFQNHPLVLVRKATAMYYLSRELDDSEESNAKAEESFALFAQARAADSMNVEAHYLPGTYLLARDRNDEAYLLLQTAAALSPAVRVHSYYWRAILGNREFTKDQRRVEVDADVSSLLANCSDSPATLRAAASAYGDVDLPEKQQALEEHLLENYPNSSEAESMLFGRITSFQSEMWEQERDAGEEDPAKREHVRGMLVEFIDRPEHHEERLLGSAYLMLFMIVQGDSTFDGDSLYTLVDSMTKYENPNLRVVYGMSAVALAERGIYLEEAEQLALTGIEKTEEQYAEYREEEVFPDEERYQMSYNWSMAGMHDALGWVYFRSGRLDEAEEELLRAHELLDEYLSTLHHLGQLYERRSEIALSEGVGRETVAEEHLKRAEELYIKGAMTQTFEDNPNEAALEALYEKRHGSLDGYEQYLGNLEETYRSLRHERILAERIEEPESLPAFVLEALDESTFTSEELSGKIAVINHWGTWCGPCVIEMPEFQELHEKYRDDPDVVVITIDYNDTVEDVQEWMAKYEYDYVVLLDDGYVRDAGVSAWPTTWFVDRDGRIVFEKMGASAALVEEFSWRVEALRNP
jgi:thiol-disulfide isomerase/thioredoxin